MNALLRPLPWILALALLQPAWHLWLAPSTWLPPVFVVVVMSLPILPAVLLGVFRRPSAGFWGGVAALLYFSHGVMELWSNPEVTALAWVETLLSVGLVIAASWRGLQARAAARRPKPAESDTAAGPDAQ
ncbi:DUF2069 domain-containing protein [Silanimonas sp.]|jgi:uncharacterized membrane protein|uniref:DUF2069 domain-containing protein n=1 Tax=Silanimonas sp. TaxID=1929290 RepID=UPI0022BC3D7D|nr:DUF2069 domain-containing protein [Silanimonas sp.]MCZ8062823.1 DUF2069 domain-containing protein [Silanimonas sp.]